MRPGVRPLVVSDMGGEAQVCRALEPLPLARNATGHKYDEDWLQSLIDDHPSVLPVEGIEPGLTGAVSVCRELPTPSGYIDNLLITRSGGIIVVEAKLWRNPQARREVVGQILDYAKDLARWSYEEFEQAVKVARRTDEALFDVVFGSEANEEDQSVFIDAVSRNLRLGRFLCLIVGDGIQESAEQLADFIQRHVGLHFTLAMVELSLWRLPDRQDVLVHPKIISRTVQIERAVVRVDGSIGPAAEANETALTVRRPVTITAEQFYEQLGRIEPGLPEKLSRFLASLEPLNVRGDIRKGMLLKWRSDSGQDFSLGYIYSDDARVSFDWCNGPAEEIGRIDLSHGYLANVASILGGGVVHETPKPVGWNVKVGGQYAPLSELLNRAEAWRDAIASYIAELSRALEGAKE